MKRVRYKPLRVRASTPCGHLGNEGTRAHQQANQVIVAPLPQRRGELILEFGLVSVCLAPGVVTALGWSLSGKGVTFRGWFRVNPSPGRWFTRWRARSSGVELQEVVGGCDQAPLGPRRGPASSSEPAHPAVVFDLPEHRLDAVSSLDVQPAAEIGREDTAHERVHAAHPAGASVLPPQRVGRDEHPEPVSHEMLDLLMVPIAGIGERRPRTLGHANVLKFANRGAHHRFQLPEVR